MEFLALQNGINGILSQQIICVTVLKTTQFSVLLATDTFGIGADPKADGFFG